MLRPVWSARGRLVARSESASRTICRALMAERDIARAGHDANPGGHIELARLNDDDWNQHCCECRFPWARETWPRTAATTGCARAARGRSAFRIRVSSRPLRGGVTRSPGQPGEGGSQGVSGTASRATPPAVYRYVVAQWGWNGSCALDFRPALLPGGS